MITKLLYSATRRRLNNNQCFVECVCVCVYMCVCVCVCVCLSHSQTTEACFVPDNGCDDKLYKENGFSFTFCCGFVWGEGGVVKEDGV